MSTQTDTTKDHSATYSPEDDKIRIYPAYRLPIDEYQQLKAAGYQWAPKQECFYTVWSPSREATALQFADEIEDEDKSLVERAEERADRFDAYSDNRAADADRARRAVSTIADNIPFGQPILVGHHSERHARKHAQQIENGMRKAVKMWETSEYWTSRAAGALANAKYKERPDVRARRIKGLEADKRKREKINGEHEKALQFWSREDLTLDLATRYAGVQGYGLTMARKEGDKPDFNQAPSAYCVLSNSYPTLYAPRTLEEVIETAKRVFPRSISYCNTWLNHINNRLAYERAMLAEGGGLKADAFNIQVGGQVKDRFGWHVVIKLNKKADVLQSVSVADLGWTVKIEDIKDYTPPAEGDAEKVAAATKLPPLCNYPGEGFFHMTEEDYKRRGDWAKGKEIKTEPSRHRICIISNRIAKPEGKSEWGYTPVYFIDKKEKRPAEAVDASAAKPTLPGRNPEAPRMPYRPPEEKPEAADFQAMKDSLKAGVQTVTAPQLFPTPPEIAAQMVKLADIKPGMSVLEPSAGTGNLIKAILAEEPTAHVHAIEINHTLCKNLESLLPLEHVDQYDFLEIDGPICPDAEQGFDRVIMNPPFENGADIKHIKHALTMLKPGGRLVALCANGSRQQAAFKETADQWEVLPAGSFASQGTSVNVALLAIKKGA